MTQFQDDFDSPTPYCATCGKLDCECAEPEEEDDTEAGGNDAR